MRKFMGVGVVGLSCAVACGQDLALPDGYGKPAVTGGAGPAEGVTGPSGAGGASSGGRSTSPVPAKVPAPAPSGGSSSLGAPAGGGASGGALAELNAAGEAATSSVAGVSGEGGAGAAAPPRLLLSEYVEGSAAFKALEVVALEGGSLEGCELRTFFNGKTEPTKLALHGALKTDEVLVLCSSSLSKEAMAPCNGPTAPSFNGNDALTLVCGDVVQDTFGEPGVDPGDGWGTGATLDHTLRRRCEVEEGRTEPTKPFLLDAEWTVFPVDTFSDLGQRACEKP